MIVSPFTPLFFISRRTDGLASEYRQIFASSDRIMLQIIGDSSWQGAASVFAEPEHSLLFNINFNEWRMNDTTTVYFTSLSLDPGCYSVSVEGIGCCEIFEVTDCPDRLKNTTLIQYAMRNNRQRQDGVFVIDGMRHFFDFRVHGGFKDSNWSFSVDNEQFTTSLGDIVQLYALESTQQKFTLGTSAGCPVWFGEMLNRILCCNYVYFDGIRYARKDSSTPEIEVQMDGVNSFVFTQSLQKVLTIDPDIESVNQSLIMRTDGNAYRVASSSTNGIFSRNVI